MKPIAIIALLFCFIASPKLPAQQALSERIRNAQLQDAALRAVEESIQILQKQVSGSAAIRAMLLAQPDKHRRRSASLQLLQNEEQDRLRAEFRRQLALFAEHVPDLPAQWAQSTLTEHSQRVDAAIQPLLRSDFRNAYRHARQEVIETQAKALEGSAAFYAQPEEIEALVAIDTLSQTPLTKLARVLEQPRGQRIVNKYADNVRRSTVLFEENENVLERKIRLTLKEQLVELQAQVNAVRSFFVDARTAQAIDANGLEQQILRQIRPSRGHGLFPSVQQQAHIRAESIERQLFAEYIENQLSVEAGCAGLPAQQVQAAIPGRFAEIPAQSADHLAQLLRTLGPAAKDKLTQGYAEQLKNAAERRPFAQKLQQLASEPGDLAALLEHGLQDCVRQPLAETRKQLAQTEIEQVYPHLADFSQELSEADIERLFEQPEIALERLVLHDFPSDDPLHLQESIARFAEIRQRFKEEGKFAITSQISLVARHQPGFGEQVREDPERAQRREFWQDAFESQVLQDWLLTRASESARPDSRMLAREKYARVFALTSRLIADSLPIDWEPETVISEENETTPETPPPLSCPQVVDLCAQAGDVCYQALQQCAGGGDCAEQLRNCETARSACISEQASLGLLLD